MPFPSGIPAMDHLFVNMPSSIHAPPQTPLPLLNHPNPSAWSATMLDPDDYDDEVADLTPNSPTSKKDKQVRRRSSKACDQCRKSKCKCERPNNRDDPCKNCILLGTPCTFLGPSRKRGPPKGYIDAIESRLHQMEALLGTLLSTNDARVRSILDDLAGDPLARDILQRVDESPFGTRGGAANGGPIIEDRAARILRTSIPVAANCGPLPYSSPSVEWQEHLKDRLKKGSDRFAEELGVELPTEEDEGEKATNTSEPTTNGTGPPKLSVNTTVIRSHPSLAALASAAAAERGESPRQRRRIDSSSSPQLNNRLPSALTNTNHTGTPSLSPSPSSPRTNSHSHNNVSTTSDSETDESDRELLASAVGQLSLNEDEQVRYHGPASGLHILHQNVRMNNRNEGGLWRFPKAGVWPRASRPRRTKRAEEEEWEVKTTIMPDQEEQERLLGLYFGYVHPVIPLLDEKAFWRAYRGEPDPEAKSSPVPSPPSHDGSTAMSSPPQPGECRVPILLLLAIFAIAARYKHEPSDPVPKSEAEMWNVGDEYLEGAKRILNQSYASSRPSTCQALLLLSFREIGIGAMAQSWLYVGMAVRMAQDLGMHRSADKWQRTGNELFSESERQVRKKIWYTCVIMDKYVSTYIGRPLSIFERDFDTPLPSEDAECEDEMKLWLRHNSAGAGGDIPDTELPSLYVPVPSQPVACFNACARLAGILGGIVESIYAVNPSSSPAQPATSRHAARDILEKRLDKWYVELPEFLRVPSVFLEASAKTTQAAFLAVNKNGAGVGGVGLPPPHVMTLHMMYWCSVLLLHRPFIRRKLQQHSAASPAASDRPASEKDQKEPSESETQSCKKAFDLCAMAATKISNLIGFYKENFCLRRAPAFLTYYVFSASIMHLTSLSVQSGDVQAGMGLQTCMDALQTMSTLWPSAGRAWELLHGAKIDMREVELARQAASVRGAHERDKRKRNNENGNTNGIELRALQHQRPQQHSPPIVPSQPYAHAQSNNGVDMGMLRRVIAPHPPPPVTQPQSQSYTQTGPSIAPRGSIHEPPPPPPQSMPHAHGLPHPHPHPQAHTHVPSHSHTHSHHIPSHPQSHTNPYNLPPTPPYQHWTPSASTEYPPSSYNPPSSHDDLSYSSFSSTTTKGASGSDIWGTATDQYGVNVPDPSLISSSLYGLPVINSTGIHTSHPGGHHQGHGGMGGGPSSGHQGGMGGFMSGYGGMYPE